MNNIKLKYNLKGIEWQQFEELSFQCVQKLVSESVVFIEEGRDKGRDFVFKGKSDYFENSTIDVHVVFQAKHKAGKTPELDLKSDLRRELEKVFITNKLEYTHYCLVTNITIKGSLYDELNEIFDTFFEENSQLNTARFKIISYRNLESCIDRLPGIKWRFPSIIAQADFKLLLDDFINKNQTAWGKVWGNLFEKNYEKFVYTKMFEKGVQLIRDKGILLFSGPPKSGKSFNANAVAYLLTNSEGFNPYIIDDILSFEQLYDPDKKQVFIFDDAFGKYDLDNQRADIIDRKILRIAEIIDSTHKCIFTSREYIYRAFKQYSDSDTKELVNKVIVETNQLTIGEKESFFLRYYKLHIEENLEVLNFSMETIVNHENFSPETIRAYFENNLIFKYLLFLEHLKNPDQYLEKLYLNLSELKQRILLTILFSLTDKLSSISYSYKKLEDDLGQNDLSSLNKNLELMEGSVIKATADGYDFYHPSMVDFFVQFTSNDIGKYKELLFKNVNIGLLSKLRFKVPEESKRLIKLNAEDVNLLALGFKRIIYNPDSTLSHWNSIIRWFGEQDTLVNFQIYHQDEKRELQSKVFDYIKANKERILDSYNISELEFFSDKVRTLYGEKRYEELYSNDTVKQLLEKNKENDEYWILVFSHTHFITREDLLECVGRDWLNGFYQDTLSEIDALGNELFGEDYPNFEEYHRYKNLIEQKRGEEAKLLKKKSLADSKQKTNRRWWTRYKTVKSKVQICKKNRAHGKPIYDLVLTKYEYLLRLENNQRDRYFFIKKKGWW